MARWERGLWKDAPGPARAELRDLYARLRKQYGPFGRAGLGRRWAKLVAEAWFTADGASTAAVLAVVKRQEGKGRRPNMRQVNQALKRQGLGVGSLDPMLRRLQDLVGGLRRPSPDELLDRVHEAMRGEGDGDA